MIFSTGRTVQSFFICSSFILGACNAELSGTAAGSGLRSGDNCADCNDDGLNAGDEPDGVEGVGWSTRYPRLSHAQWENSVRDLLYRENGSNLSEAFALDPDAAAFDTHSTLTVSANLWNDYQRAAEILAAETASNPTALDRLLPSSGERSGEALVSHLGERAFRRPLSSDESAAYLALFEQGGELMDNGSAFESGAEMVIRALLQSPHFLYRVESSVVAEGERIWLDDFEMATRLSYALWNTMPSDELFEAARAGELSTQEGVRKWALSMLDDERAKHTLVSFHEQLFHVESYGTVRKNASLFPEFTPELAPALQQEASLFFEHISAEQDGGIAALFTTPTTFVNASTAGYYGTTAPVGEGMTRVELDPSQRAGILTQLGFLSRYGSQTQSDPILRGVHISLELLCSALPAPPNDIPPLPAIAPNQTNRQRVEESTSVRPCSTCHENHINPLGFAFENYDAVGKWRDIDNGQPVDASAVFTIDGEDLVFDNAVELSTLLAESQSLHRCYAEKWLEYAMGRPPADEEERLLENLSEVSRNSSSLRALLSSLVSLDTFRARAPESHSL